MHMFGIVCRYISNSYNTPVSSYEKRKAGMDVAQAATEEIVKKREVAAAAWYQKHGEFYERRLDADPPLPAVRAVLAHAPLSAADEQT